MSNKRTVRATMLVECEVEIEVERLPEGEPTPDTGYGNHNIVAVKSVTRKPSVREVAMRAHWDALMPWVNAAFKDEPEKVWGRRCTSCGEVVTSWSEGCSDSRVYYYFDGLDEDGHPHKIELDSVEDGPTDYVSCGNCGAEHSRASWEDLPVEEVVA